MSSSTTACIFDLDGVLVDTHEAVRAAYNEVGIMMPHRAWGAPWAQWLPNVCNGDRDAARRLHQRKNEVYHRFLYRTELLEGALAYRWLLDSGASVIIATSASDEAARQVLLHHEIPHDHMYTGLSSPRRYTLFRELQDKYHDIIVIDDQDERRGIVPTPGKFIHYRSSMPREELLMEILRCVL